MKSTRLPERGFTLLLVVLCAACSTNDPLVVGIEQGLVRGTQTAVSDAFLSLPYAAPPVGDLRWQGPQAPLAWESIRDAGTKSAMCMQPPRGGDDDRNGDLHTSEDCLYLNVWRPRGTRVGADLPVMFWIHGGSYLFGSAMLSGYDGDFLTSRGVILVSINYRLGVFGSFTHPELETEQAGQARASYGLLDQIAALEWVQKNIGRFGGDRNNVTIFGNSAGGASVNILSITPAAEGLFHRAIAQSGGIRVEDTAHATQEGVAPTAPPLIAAGNRMAEDLNAPDLAALRTLSAAQILEWQVKNGRGPYGPVIDGVLLTDLFAKPFVTGDMHDIDFIFGVDSWEGSILAGIPIPPAAYLKFFLEVDEVRAAYGNPNDAAMKTVMLQDKTFFGGARFLSRYAARHGRTAYLYRFSYRPTAVRDDGLPGAAHSDEVPFIFNNLPGTINSAVALSKDQITDEDRAMAKTMADYWTNFAKTGDPNGAGLPTWPIYTEENDTWIDLGTQIKPLPGYRAKDMDFWEMRYLKYLE